MFEEPFAHGASFLHGLDPRFRLGITAIAAVCLAVLRSAGGAFAALVLAGGLLAVGRPPLGWVAKRLCAVNVFILFLWLTVPVFGGGEILTIRGPVAISRSGVELSTLVTLKANAMLFLFLALAASMDSPTFGHALARLRVPPKLVFLFLFTYRYIHVIAEEWGRLWTAARLRGFTPRTDRHSYRTIGNMLGMVFVGSFDRAVRVYEAMLLRGFSGHFQSVAVFRARPRDVAFALTALLCLAGVLAFDVYPDLFRAWGSRD